jgi:hypothetical protein
MATFQLMLTRLYCVTETDEGGNDSPYVLVFIGHRGASPKSKVLRVRDPAWDGALFSGRAINTLQMVSEEEISNAVVLVSLVEEDWDPDLGSGGFLQTMMQVQWQVYGGSGWANLTNAQVAQVMRDKFATLVKASLSNDEYIQTRVQPIAAQPVEGPMTPLSFSGDGGSYNITFSIRKKGD